MHRTTRFQKWRSSAVDRFPRPGEISLAHNGVLFLDELPEFDRRALEALRQPFEEGRVTITRTARTSTFPARFMLVAAMNPCPCGFRGDQRRACRCSEPQIERYAGRISGPLRDRIDLVVEVPAVGVNHASRRTRSPPRRFATRVDKRGPDSASDSADRNSTGSSKAPNCECIVRSIRKARALLDAAVQRFFLSARGCDRVLTSQPHDRRPRRERSDRLGLMLRRPFSIVWSSPDLRFKVNFWFRCVDKLC